jgi:Type III restriction enzyme, res subunit
MNLERLRPGQAESIRVARQRLRAGQTQTAFEHPPRTGKSHIIRWIAMDLWLRNEICCTLVLSVNRALADQMCEATEWEAAIRLAEMDVTPKIRRLEFPTINPTANGEMFLSATIQLVQHNIEIFADWIRMMVRQTGRPVLVVFDECHLTSLTNTWGQVCQMLVDAGAHIHYYTGTAMRADGVRMPGFDYDIKDTQALRVWVPRRHEDPQKCWIDLYEGVEQVLEIQAHVKTTFAEAWSNKYLCKISSLPFDVCTEDGQKLSEIDSTILTRHCLRASLRDPVVLKQGLMDLVTEVSRYRSIISTIGAIIFTGHDESTDQESNAHAKKIRQMLKRIAPSFVTLIATSADGTGKEELQRFKDGIGDVLIVKDMASLGISIPRLKVGLDFSPVRTPAAWLQRVNRIATPYQGIYHAVWITPDDILARALWAQFISTGGGEITARELELIRSEERDKREQMGREFIPETTTYTDFEDTLRNRAEASQRPTVQELLRRLPHLSTFYSHAELALAFEDVIFRRSDGIRIENTGDVLQTLRDEINHEVDRIMTARIAEAGYSAQEYGDTRRDIYIRAYQTLAIREHHLEDIDSVVTLERIRDLLKQWRRSP